MLFDSPDPTHRPLAAQLRPKSLDDVIGQDHLLGPTGPIARIVDSGRPRSMVFWGPPGVGKTTIALLLADAFTLPFRHLSAVDAGIRDVRKVIDEARHSGTLLLFLDEIHRFNKGQQDALLPAVEDGTIILIGATTENPSFEINRPLLSRLAVYTLKPLDRDGLAALLERASSVEPRIAEMSGPARDEAVDLAGGDGRKLLTGLSIALELAESESSPDVEQIRNGFGSSRIYDKSADAHYDIASAFIKSMRGSDPDAALFWAARAIDGGEDPLFLARRMMIFASEDIGNADPYAITLAVNIYRGIERLGMPEGRILLGQGITYLATALKSNASYRAMDAALADAERNGDALPPLELRNAPTRLMKAEGYGRGYRYPHDEPGGFTGDRYLPEELGHPVYYRPTDRGREASILERLRAWWPKRKR